MRVILFLSLIFTALINPVFGTSNAQILFGDRNYYGLDFVEYERIFWQIKNASAEESQWRKACLEIVKNYQTFLKDYPKSELVDDAKLRIAEFYELGGRKDKAKKWLDEIIKNHSEADYYSIVIQKNNGEKTAAWALFYRGYWFKEKKYLLLIVESYQNSPKAVEQAKIILAEWEKRVANKATLFIYRERISIFVFDI